MFDFDKDETGSHLRYLDRLGYNPYPTPRIKHWGWWLLHNCITHPLIGVMPIKPMFEFHDWTSRRLNRLPRKL
jgi:hypothetical protein